MSKYYRRVEMTPEGTAEPVQYVGVYALHWHDRPAHPEVACAQTDIDEKLAEAERQRGDLLDACIAEDLAHNHRQTCEWCLAVGWDHPGCWEHAGLRAHAYKLRQAALASVRGDE